MPCAVLRRALPCRTMLCSLQMSKKLRLTFELEGQDLTQQDTDMTQRLINSELATELMCDAVFFGQNDVTRLLEVCRLVGRSIS